MSRKLVVPTLALLICTLLGGLCYWQLRGLRISFSSNTVTPPPFKPAPLPGSYVLIAPGESRVLTWTIENSPRLHVTLDPGNIDVTALRSFRVQPKETTLYTLTASDPHGTTQKSMLVIVSNKEHVPGWSGPNL